jgi:hypothetical protein
MITRMPRRVRALPYIPLATLGFAEGLGELGKQSTRERGKSRYATPRSSAVCRGVCVTARSALLDRDEELGSAAT